MIQTVYSGYQIYKVPLEGIILENYNNAPQETFTVSSEFKDLASFIKVLNSGNQKLVIGLSYVISNS